MEAAVYRGPGKPSIETLPDPEIVDDTDAVVRIDTTTICGTDLHILGGDVPTVEDGRVLGHEAVGTVEAVGAGVRTLTPGDRVLISCITACGRCAYCRTGSYSQCQGGGGWILGHRIDGVQATAARVPFADTSTHKVPEGVADETVLFLADILPTGYEVGVLNGGVRPGDTVVVVGAGPIGLAAIMTARLLTPARIVAVDPASTRREAALRFGADDAIDNAAEDAVARVNDLTDGLGADVAIEAVGIPATFELCTQLIRPCGRVANAGVHGEPSTLHLEELWIRNVTITTGLVDTSSTPELLRLIAAGRIDPSPFATHRFGLDQLAEAYETFADPVATGALKIVISRR